MQRSQSKTGLNNSDAKWLVSHKHELDGRVPGEDEVWGWGDVDLDRGTLYVLSDRGLIQKVDAGEWRSSKKLCEALRAYYDDPCISFPREQETLNTFC